MSFISIILEEYEKIEASAKRLFPEEEAVVKDILSTFLGQKLLELSNCVELLQKVSESLGVEGGEAEEDKEEVEGEEAQEKEEEQLSVISPFDLSTLPEFTGPPINSLAMEEEQQYHLKFPPEPLTNQDLNKKIIGIKVPPDLLLYLRLITHPHKPQPDQADLYYLSYLVQVEQYPAEIISYLLSGTGAELATFDGIKPEEPVDTKCISYIAKYISFIGEHAKNDPERLRIIVTPERIAVDLKRKKTLFDPALPERGFRFYMAQWGFLHEPISQKYYGKK